MRSLLVDTLKKIYPTYPQGSLSPDEYPDHFFTYWNYEKPERYADNKPVGAVWGFWVYHYSSDSRTHEKALQDAMKALRAEGFIIENPGVDAASDKRSHTGRMMTVKYIESY